MTGAVTALAAVAAAVGGLRWLRVAQREHYLKGSVVRFAIRWWLSTSWNRIMLATVSIGAVLVWWWAPAGWTALALVAGPLGLSIRGTSSPLQWTARIRRLAALAGGLASGGILASVTTGRPGWGLATALLIPLLVELSLAALAPVERRLGAGWVERAARKLSTAGARVVAITGSYGKTTTKGYVHHLLSGHLSTVSTPGSFNNRMGLARSINEHLLPGAEVFIAEMGTYSKGEIAELCEFVKPDVAAITSIGPVHLERFGTEEAIVEAKAEILADARVAVLNVDHPLLASLADREEGRLKVIRVSGSDIEADVAVVDGELTLAGRPVGTVGREVFGPNLAIAAAVAAEYGVSPEEIARRLVDLPAAPHRREQLTSERGFLIIDDTYNSNPAGAAAALELLWSLPGDGRRVVVTPGMVELGPRQFDANVAFAREAAARASNLLVVGLTNRHALLSGSEGSKAAVTVLRSREEAVIWVRSHLGTGDAVLYENDLPDHYP